MRSTIEITSPQEAASILYKQAEFAHQFYYDLKIALINASNNPKAIEDFKAMYNGKLFKDSMDVKSKAEFHHEIEDVLNNFEE